MGIGIFFIFVSIIWGLILVIRVESLMGQKFFIISGSNIFNARGFELSNGLYLVMWLVAVLFFCFGLWLLIDSQKRTDTISSSSDNTKKCPRCAELIRLEAKVCKHCNHHFSEEDVEKTIKERLSANGKFCHSCGKTDSYYDANGDLFCPNCRKIIS